MLVAEDVDEQQAKVAVDPAQVAAAEGEDGVRSPGAEQEVRGALAVRHLHFLELPATALPPRVLVLMIGRVA